MNIALTSQHDLVVIGAGIAGLTAAVRAAELGLRVCVLEQGAEAAYPCNTRYSGGIIHGAFYDLTRPADELAELIDTATQHKSDVEMVRTVATDGRRLLTFLQDHGVRFMRFTPKEAHRWCMAPPRPIGPGLDWKGRGPDVLLRSLGQALRTHGGTIQLDAHTEHLQIEDGRCVGVAGQIDNAEHVWRAGSVVIADGGYQANLDMLREHVGPHPERLLQRGASNSRGDGVKMAIAAGAATRGMDAFYGHVLNRKALTDPDCWPYPELDGVATSAIVVTPDGKRFFDEGLGGIAIANALARLEDPASTTLICDTKIWDGPGKSARFPANPYMEKFGGTIHRADRLPDLAAKAGIAADQLIATVEHYNAAVAAGKLGALSPGRTDRNGMALPIAGAPYIAIPLCAGITHTMGGIVVDGHGCVRRPDGSTIAGLYAAGTTTAGLDGGLAGGGISYVGGLVKSVFGLCAAEHAAARANVIAMPKTG
jgi:fumarate reductase flavoprotein subunit